MAEIFGFEKLLSFVSRKKFGPFNQFGTSQYANSNFGDEDICWGKAFFGYAEYGYAEFGDGLIWSGIYRTDNVSGYTRYYREPYYITRNPRTPDQQAWRQKFADAMAAWQVLTPEEKLVYTKYAHKIHLWGRNLFIREYLRSH